MEALSVEFEPFIDDGVRRFINDGVDNHNIATTALAPYFPTNFVLRSRRGEVLGGLLGMIWGGWLQVGTLWVALPVRGQGHGSRLLDAAESYAVDRGCGGVLLDTFSFQARGFYERHGYTVFATLPDYPPGHARHFLTKPLTGAANARSGTKG